MKDDDRLVNAIIDLHQEITGMRTDMNRKFDTLTDRVEKVEGRIVKVEGQLIMNNKAIGELRLSVMRTAEQTQKLADYDRRIRKIETALVRKNLL